MLGCSWLVLLFSLCWTGWRRLRGRGMSPDIQMRLYESRELFRREIRAALSCTRKSQKIKLVKRWQEQYPPILWEQLLSVARKPEVAKKIADWYLEKPNT